jgi:hypothetical protein
MKEKDEFLKKMENLQVPDINPTDHPEMVKMAIMNADRSAALGVWLVILPCYFLFCVFNYYFFHVHISWFAAMFKLMESLDDTPGISFLGPLIFVILPIICMVINALAITHVKFNKTALPTGNARQIGITIKIKLWNILLILISLAIVFVFIVYVMTENITVR